MGSSGGGSAGYKAPGGEDDGEEEDEEEEEEEDPVVNDDADGSGSASGGSPSDARRMRSSEKTIPARTRTRHAPAIQATPRRLTPAVPTLIRAGGRERRPAGTVRARREVDAGTGGERAERCACRIRADVPRRTS
jgi:hypothetical protein